MSLRIRSSARGVSTGTCVLASGCCIGPYATEDLRPTSATRSNETARTSRSTSIVSTVFSPGSLGRSDLSGTGVPVPVGPRGWVDCLGARGEVALRRIGPSGCGERPAERESAGGHVVCVSKSAAKFAGAAARAAPFTSRGSFTPQGPRPSHSAAGSGAAGSCRRRSSSPPLPSHCGGGLRSFRPACGMPKPSALAEYPPSSSSSLTSNMISVPDISRSVRLCSRTVDSTESAVARTCSTERCALDRFPASGYRCGFLQTATSLGDKPGGGRSTSSGGTPSPCRSFHQAWAQWSTV